MNDKYLGVGRAGDLEGRDKIIYRLFEILPGLLSWLTLIGIFLGSWFFTFGAAISIIIFDLYWLVKTIYLSTHLRANWKKLRRNKEVDWTEKLNNFKYNHLWQMVLLPFYREETGIIFATMETLIGAKYNKKKMIIVLAYEERAGENAEKIAQEVEKKYQDKFAHFLTVKHPQNLPGEMAGKGSNCAYAVEEARKKILDVRNINYEDVLISTFDIDTRVYPQYFSCLTWHFLTCENPYCSSFQPVPVYNNNIWEAPAFSRVVATSGTFWQMIQQERPEQLATFSSHSMSFKTLYEVGYWQKNIVSEDSRIFWNCWLYFKGDYRVIPLSYPVSMDANLALTFWHTAKNVYKQQRRWFWGTAENTAYVFFGCLRNKKIVLRKKLRRTLVKFEGAWSSATNPLIIFFLGWLPLILGGDVFNETLLSYNLPRVTRNIMTLAMTGLFVSAIISTTLLPPLPA